MASTVESPSRRSVLGAALGAAIAGVAAVLGRPAPVRAEGEAIQIGEEYTTATSRTRIRNETNDADVLAESATNGTAVVGISTGATGIAGSSGSGTGVYAASASGIGIDAFSGQGQAVNAVTSTGIAIQARSNNPLGYALTTVGRLKLGTSGIAIIPAGSTSVTISLAAPFAGVDITSNSIVLLSPNADLGARRLWWSKSIPTDSITIHLSPSRPTPTRVSWLLLG
jgi:hypothetical protein